MESGCGKMAAFIDLHPKRSSLGLCTSQPSLLERPMVRHFSVLKNTVRIHMPTFHGWNLELLHALYLAVETLKLMNLVLCATEHSPHLLEFPFPDKVVKRLSLVYIQV